MKKSSFIKLKLTSSLLKLDKYENFFYLSILSAFMIMLGVSSRVIPPDLYGWDFHTYVAMANNPAAFLSIVPHYAQRILPSLFIFALKNLTNLSVDELFRLTMIATYVLIAFFAFKVMKIYNISSYLCTLSIMMIFSSHFIFRFDLWNIYQLCDSWTMLCSLIFVFLSHKRAFFKLIILTFCSFFIKQNLIILSSACLLYTGYREKKLFLSSLILFFDICVFLIFSKFCGIKIAHDSSSPWIADVYGIVLKPLFAFNTDYFQMFYKAFKETAFPLLFSPFLFMALTKKFYKILKNHWWTLPFIIITICQPFVSYSFTGPLDGPRLMTLAIFLVVVFMSIPMCLVVQRTNNKLIFFFYLIMEVFFLYLSTRGTTHFVSYECMCVGIFYLLARTQLKKPSTELSLSKV